MHSFWFKVFAQIHVGFFIDPILCRPLRQIKTKQKVLCARPGVDPLRQKV